MSKQEAHDLIRKQVTSNDIVLFMKGTKQSPRLYRAWPRPKYYPWAASCRLIDGQPQGHRPSQLVS
jgi:hypothetical protein